MATIQTTYTPSGNSRTMIANWNGLANGDDGAPIKFSQYADKSVQVTGNFGVGGSVSMEGSNNGVDWAPLSDPSGNALNIIAPKIKMITEATLLVRPRVTAGDGSTLLNVTLLIKE